MKSLEQHIKSLGAWVARKMSQFHSAPYCCSRRLPSCTQAKCIVNNKKILQLVVGPLNIMTALNYSITCMTMSLEEEEILLTALKENDMV